MLEGDETADAAEARFRYGAVLVLTVLVLLFLIAVPTTDWSRAVALALQGGALAAVAVTSRGPGAVRRERLAAVTVAIVALLVGTGVGLLPDPVIGLALAIVNLALIIALFRGIVTLVRSRGVTPQAVAGALAVYLLLGLLFAWVIGFVAEVMDTRYFAQGTDADLGRRVYFSFTTMTTTGYGDLTPNTAGGRALAVLEMLVGQIYLVTVIGVLVGNVAGRRRRGDD